MQLKSSVLSAAVKSALVAAGLAAGVASAMTPGAYEARPRAAMPTSPSA